VIKTEGNNAIVSLPYGLEGSCHAKHLIKEDGNAVAAEESAEFVVLEFNRNAKRITVSHTRTFEEAPQATATPSKERKPRSSGGNNRMMNEVNSSVERSTFGDFDVLNALKEQMDGGETGTEQPEETAAEAPKKAPTKKATKKEESEVEEIAATAEPTTEEPSEAEPDEEKAETKKPAAKKPAAKKPAAKKPAAKKPAAKKPAAKKPAAKKPAAKKAPAKSKKADDAETTES